MIFKTVRLAHTPQGVSVGMEEKWRRTQGSGRGTGRVLQGAGGEGGGKTGELMSQKPSENLFKGERMINRVRCGW